MSIEKGDQVQWGTPQGATTGIAHEKRTSPFQHDRQKFDASVEEPYWIVESDKSGATVAHKESTLTRTSDG